MEAKIHNLGIYEKGDTFPTRIFRLNTGSVSAPIPIDITGATIRMHWRTSPKAEVFNKEISIGSGITVLDPSIGRFQIDAFIIQLPANTYYYDIEFTSSTGVVRTYMKGTFIVNQDITR